MPVVRYNDNCNVIAELRQWGLMIVINGKTLDLNGKPAKVRRDVFNAMSEKLTLSSIWKWLFKKRRCQIPMSS